MPSNRCDDEGCLTDEDDWEKNLLDYLHLGGRFEYLRGLDALLRQSCISRGSGCPAELKFRLFGIPSTKDHRITLVLTDFVVLPM